MGIKKSKTQIISKEKKELLAIHPDLHWLQDKMERSVRSVGLDRPARLDSLRKVLESESNVFDSETQQVTRLIELLRSTTNPKPKKGGGS
jgi:hypothetical protein